METLTHWKKAFKSDYLSSSDIDGKDLNLTISNVKYIECVTQSGKKYCNVAFFSDTKLDRKGICISGTKPMILNVTNSKLVKAFSGNKTHLEHWINIAVTVYVDNNVQFGRDTVEGLRIKPVQPKPVIKKASIEMKDLKATFDFLKGGKTLEDLKKHRTVSVEIETELKKLANEAKIQI